MAVKHGPKGAIPTLRGWIDPRTGELLKSQRFTQEQLDEYNGVQMLVEPAPVVEPEVTMDEVVEGDEVELILDTVQEVPKPKKKKKKRTLFG